MFENESIYNDRLKDPMSEFMEVKHDSVHVTMSQRPSPAAEARNHCSESASSMVQTTQNIYIKAFKKRNDFEGKSLQTNFMYLCMCRVCMVECDCRIQMRPI